MLLSAIFLFRAQFQRRNNMRGNSSMRMLVIISLQHYILFLSKTIILNSFPKIRSFLSFKPLNMTGSSNVNQIFNKQKNNHIFVKAMSETELVVWGSNSSSVLSKSSTSSIANPQALSLPYPITKMSAGDKHVAFITKSGQLFTFGNNTDGRLGVAGVMKCTCEHPVKVNLDRVELVSCGFSHMCAKSRDCVFAWGLGEYGALGTGEYKSSGFPVRVCLDPSVSASISQISCGAMHTAFLTSYGEVYLCGSNQYGQVGRGKQNKVASPVPLHFSHSIKQVQCGVFYTLLLTVDGRVYGLGNNQYGQLGIGHKVNECQPTLIRDLGKVLQVSAGYHSGAIDENGDLYLWGSGSFGEILRPKKFVLSAPVRYVSIGGFFGVAYGDNRLFTWGNNISGQLGTGNYEPTRAPQEVTQMRKYTIDQVVTGMNFVLITTSRKNYALNDQLTKRHSCEYYRQRSHQDESIRKLSTLREVSLTPIQCIFENQKETLMNNSFEKQPLKTNRYEVGEFSTKNYQAIDNASLRKQIGNLHGEILNMEREVLKKEYQVKETRDQRRMILQEAMIQDQIKRQQESAIYRMLDQEKRKILRLEEDKVKLQLQIKELQKIWKDERNILQNQIQKLELKIQEEEKVFHNQIKQCEVVRQSLQNQLIKLEDKIQSQSLAPDLTSKVSLLQDELQLEKLEKKKQIQYSEKLEKKVIQYEDLIQKLQRELRSQVQFRRSSDIETRIQPQVEILKLQLSKNMNTIDELLEKINQGESELLLQKEINIQNKKLLQKAQYEIQAYKKEKIQSDFTRKQQIELIQSYKEDKKISEEMIEKQIEWKQNQVRLEKKCMDFEKNQWKMRKEIQDLKNDQSYIVVEVQKEKNKNIMMKQEQVKIQEQLESVRQQKHIIEKKLIITSGELERQLQEREIIMKQLGEKKREINRVNLVKGELQKDLQIVVLEKEKAASKLQIKIQENDDLSQQLEQMIKKNKNLTKQNDLIHEQLNDLKLKFQKQQKIIHQLSEANQEYWDHQKQLENKVKVLENNIKELSDVDISYEERYNALLKRNKELDERNLELSALLNKAIEKQALEYKKKLKQSFQFDLQNIIHSQREEKNKTQILQDQRQTQRKPSSLPLEKETKQEILLGDKKNQSPRKRGTGISESQGQTYQMLSKKKIEEHRKKVSESANKLMNILGKKQTKSKIEHHSQNDEYEKVRKNMDSLSQDKKEFMKKVQSFTDKYKLLC